MVDEIEIPNTVTCKTFEDTDAGRDLVHVEDAGEMFEQLGFDADAAVIDALTIVEAQRAVQAPPRDAMDVEARLRMALGSLAKVVLVLRYACRKS